MKPRASQSSGRPVYAQRASNTVCRGQNGCRLHYRKSSLPEALGSVIQDYVRTDTYHYLLGSMMVEKFLRRVGAEQRHCDDWLKTDPTFCGLPDADVNDTEGRQLSRQASSSTFSTGNVTKVSKLRTVKPKDPIQPKASEAWSQLMKIRFLSTSPSAMKLELV